MLVEFLLNNAFLAAAACLLGGATVYMWTSHGEAFMLDVGDAVMRINKDNAVVVDLRSRQDYEKGFIPGARQIDPAELENKAEGLAKKRPLLLVCANGAASSTKARKLVADGLEDVSVLKGGMRSWIEASQPLHRKK